MPFAGAVGAFGAAEGLLFSFAVISEELNMMVCLSELMGSVGEGLAMPVRWHRTEAFSSARERQSHDAITRLASVV